MDKIIISSYKITSRKTDVTYQERKNRKITLSFSSQVQETKNNLKLFKSDKRNKKQKKRGHSHFLNLCAPTSLLTILHVTMHMFSEAPPFTPSTLTRVWAYHSALCSWLKAVLLLWAGLKDRRSSIILGRMLIYGRLRERNPPNTRAKLMINIRYPDFPLESRALSRVNLRIALRFFGTEVQNMP